jgi:hypothetical protein
MKAKTAKSVGNAYLEAAFMEVVENQLRDNDPPETRETFDRLLAGGHTRKAAKMLIGQATAIEVYAILKTQKPFNRTRFIRNLKALPEGPKE